MLKKLWDKLGEEKFSCRVIVIGCTLMTVYCLCTTEVPTEFAVLMGAVNGALIVAQLLEEFDD